MLTKFDAMLSKDGEKVILDQPITVTNKTNVKEWLKQLESGMQTTLAKLLNEAVEEVQASEVSATTPDQKTAFVNWATRYPAQVMILGKLYTYMLFRCKKPSSLTSCTALTIFSITCTLEHGDGCCITCF